MKYCWSLLFVLFLFTSLFSQLDLSLNLQKGKTYYSFTNNLITIIEAQGDSEIHTITTEKGGFSFKVLKDLDSLYLMETEFTYLSMQVETADGVTNYSSEKIDPADVMSSILRKTMNKPFKVLMRKDNSWKETYGLDSIFLHTTDEYNLSPEIRHQVDSIMLAGVKEMSGVDIALTAVLYGSKKMFPNEVWTSQFITEHVVPTEDSCTYYLAETTGDFITVKGNGIVESLKNEQKVDDETQVNNLNGITDIIVKYSKDSHWILDASVKTEIKGYIEITNTQSLKKKTPMRIITLGTISGY